MKDTEQDIIIAESDLTRNKYFVFSELNIEMQHIIFACTNGNEFNQFYYNYYNNYITLPKNKEYQDTKIIIKLNIITDNICYQSVIYNMDNDYSAISLVPIYIAKLYYVKNKNKLINKIIYDFDCYIKKRIEYFRYSNQIRLHNTCVNNHDSESAFLKKEQQNNEYFNNLKQNISYDLSDDSDLTISINLDNSKEICKTVYLDNLNNVFKTVNNNILETKQEYCIYNINFLLQKNNNCPYYIFINLFKFKSKHVSDYMHFLKTMLNFLEECKLYAILNYPNSSEYDFINNLIQIISHKINYINNNKTDKTICKKLQQVNYVIEKSKIVNTNIYI